MVYSVYMHAPAGYADDPLCWAGAYSNWRLHAIAKIIDTQSDDTQLVFWSWVTLTTNPR